MGLKIKHSGLGRRVREYVAEGGLRESWLALRDQVGQGLTAPAFLVNGEWYRQAAGCICRRAVKWEAQELKKSQSPGHQGIL